MAYPAQNVAYDLSRYEPRSAAVHPEPKLRVVEQSAQRDGLSGLEIFRGALLVTALALALSMVLYSNAILTELSDQIYTQNEKLAVMTSEHQRMSAELEGKMSLRSIEDTARNQMGLAKMEPYQVQYINRCDGDKIVRTAQSPKASLLDQVGSHVGGFLEYLRGAFHNN